MKDEISAKVGESRRASALRWGCLLFGVALAGALVFLGQFGVAVGAFSAGVGASAVLSVFGKKD